MTNNDSWGKRFSPEVRALADQFRPLLSRPNAYYVVALSLCREVHVNKLYIRIRHQCVAGANTPRKRITAAALEERELARLNVRRWSLRACPTLNRTANRSELIECFTQITAAVYPDARIPDQVATYLRPYSGERRGALPRYTLPESADSALRLGASSVAEWPPELVERLRRALPEVVEVFERAASCAVREPRVDQISKRPRLIRSKKAMTIARVAKKRLSDEALALAREIRPLTVHPNVRYALATALRRHVHSERLRLRLAMKFHAKISRIRRANGCMPSEREQELLRAEQRERTRRYLARWEDAPEEGPPISMDRKSILLLVAQLLDAAFPDPPMRTLLHPYLSAICPGRPGITRNARRNNEAAAKGKRRRGEDPMMADAIFVLGERDDGRSWPASLVERLRDALWSVRERLNGYAACDERLIEWGEDGAATIPHEARHKARQAAKTNATPAKPSQRKKAAKRAVRQPRRLTEKQGRAWDLRSAGWSFQRIADEMGISKSAAEKHVNEARRKIGNWDAPRSVSATSVDPRVIQDRHS